MPNFNVLVVSSLFNLFLFQLFVGLHVSGSADVFFEELYKFILWWW